MTMIMWLISCIPLVGTAVMLLFLPDQIPIHYDLSGSIDRWGSKYESLIFPVIILAFCLFWTLLIRYAEKKGAFANVRVFRLTGIAVAAVFAVMQGVLLFYFYGQTAADIAWTAPDITRVICILLGTLCILLGCLLPKSGVNRIFGVRVSWSMYNDVTWDRSNRFGGYALIAAGVAAILSSVFCHDSLTAILVLIAALIAATVVILVYAYRVYKTESSKRHNT